jgi:hypothetical protein
MKTSKFTAFRAALVGALVLGATSAVAVTTGQVTLGGTVSPTASLTVSNASGTGLDLTTNSEQIVKVAKLTTVTNNSSGLTLTVTSGDMVTADAQTPIAYQVTTQAFGTVNPPVTADFGIASGTDYEVVTSAPGTNEYDLYIRYTPAEYQDPDTYSATIDVSVEDNL